MTDVHDWTDEDIRFVITDVHHGVDDEGRELARACMHHAAEHVKRIHTELGHPDGFDPRIYGLIYARAAFTKAFEYGKELGQAQQEVVDLRGLLVQAKAVIQDQRSKLDMKEVFRR